ncbi:uncharacterized protein LOC122299590 [Carya illinoinensis]|uniref:uncharacterized protein LOC122299590 n=1 Tax=Carya illinoinensis TaxID=32201 RepID=UPI001C721E5E|nr:uncharacterized protein LOC122299590 [Carya illinoinensis]
MGTKRLHKSNRNYVPYQDDEPFECIGVSLSSAATRIGAFHAARRDLSQIGVSLSSAATLFSVEPDLNSSHPDAIPSEAEVVSCPARGVTGGVVAEVGGVGAPASPSDPGQIGDGRSSAVCLNRARGPKKVTGQGDLYNPGNMQDGRAEESYSEPENGIAEHLSKNKQYPSDSDETKEKTQGKDENSLDMLKNTLKFEHSFSNQCAGGKLWVLWGGGLHITVTNFSSQHITISLVINSQHYVISVVYARCSYLERRELWRSLHLDAVQDIPWLCLGDFNITRREEERRGGRPRLRIAMDDFNEFIDTCGLMEMKSVGSKFSWCNGQRGLSRSWSKIDRCMMNSLAVTSLPDAFCRYLARTTSDHAPMSFVLKSLHTRYGPTPFKFQQMWASHENFIDVVKNAWNEPILPRGIFSLTTKLKKMKGILKEWNRRVFGHTETNIQNLEKQIEDLENQLQIGFSESVESELVVARENLDTWLQREEIRLNQQAKINWTEKGEASAQFFRTYVSRSKPVVQEMRCRDGSHLTTPESIHSGAVDFFSTFLQARPHRDLPDLSTYVHITILEEENDSLLKFPSIQEVKEAMFSIPVDSSPGPDGFGSGFYRVCWDLVEADVVAAVRDMYSGVPMPRFYSASYIALIPKMQQPTGFDKFRPISLCSVIYKVFAKILVRRMSPILSRIISPEQGAFLPGRSIFENITLAQEMIHMINRKVRGGNVLIKVDIAKAYDSLDWDFLLHVMTSFGFSTRFCELIRQCISTPWFSMVMNGSAKGFFPSGRGLRQGDPLSPYLFILVQETLSRLIKHNFEMEKIAPYSHPRGTPLISHLFYADDIVVFANGGRASLQAISDVFALYESWWGKVVSKEKSSIFFPKYVNSVRKRNILQLTSFSEGLFPVKYLGVPLFSGRLKVSYFEDLMNRIRDRLEGWQNRLLSAGARLLLLRHVVSSIPVHLLSVLHTPKKVVSSLNRIMSNFFWGISNGKQKRKWVAWKKVCMPTKEGGLGLRKFEEVQSSLFMKLAWNLLSSDSLWANFFRKKYCKGEHVTLVDNTKGSPLWRCIMTMVPNILNNAWWRVREGQVSFWRDPWLKTGPLVESCEMTAQSSLRSAWECIRVHAPKSEWANWIWHPALPKKYSITIWKALNHSLSVDVRIRHLGIPLASRCECCEHRCIEDQDHVLATGKVASDVWRRASILMGMPYDHRRPWKANMELWFRKASLSTQKGTLLGIVPVIITWSLWVWRCKARMEGKMQNGDRLWGTIKAALAWVGLRLRTSKRFSDGDDKVLRNLGIPMKVGHNTSPCLVKWNKPSVGWAKLNVDGSSLGNPGQMGAGGIIRDDKGRMMWAYAKEMEVGTNNEAELRALYYGLKYCKDLALEKIEIEVDSLLVANWLRGGRCSIWYLEDYWEEIQDILNTLVFKVMHVFREGNAGADFLARLASEKKSATWANFNDVPHILKGILKVDKMGLYALRK